MLTGGGGRKQEPVYWTAVHIQVGDTCRFLAWPKQKRPLTSKTEIRPLLREKLRPLGGFRIQCDKISRAQYAYLVLYVRYCSSMTFFTRPVRSRCQKHNHNNIKNCVSVVRVSRSIRTVPEQTENYVRE